jgi:hypothetical protein
MSAITLVHAQSAELPSKVDGRQLSILLRTTMVALHQANITGNYTVLRDIGSLSFRNLNTPSRLSDVFRPIREARLDLSEAVLVDPILQKKPRIDGNGMLHMEGYFPIKPLAPTYRMVFRWEENAWRLFSISVGAEKLEAVQQSKSSGSGG